MNETTLELPEIELPAAFGALARPKRVKVFFGGRGSGKSETIGRQLCLDMEADPDLKVLCSRMYQNSMDDSVYGMLSAFVAQYAFPFDVRATEIRAAGSGGFKFKGLARNINNIKSLFGFDRLWVEEAEDVPARVWDKLIPTFRKGGSELWVSFNPADEADATYQQFVAPYLDAINTQGFHEDEYLYVRRVNFNENPFFPDVLRVESARLKQQNYKKWLHVYQGEPDMEYLDSLIEPEWFEAAVDAHQRLGFEPRGERVCGFDPADTGADAKARALRYGVLIEDVASWLDGDVTDATQKAVDDALAFRATALVYDNIGNGASVKTYATLGGAPAGLAFHGFGAGDTPDDPDQAFDAATADETAPKTNRDTFRNKRAQYWWLLRGRFYRTWEAVVKGRYHDPLTLISLNGHMPQRAQLKRELVKVQRKRTPGLQLIQIESKEEMRKRGIPSPNLADSLMMSFAVPEKSSYRYERRPVRR